MYLQSKTDVEARAIRCVAESNYDNEAALTAVSPSSAR